MELAQLLRRVALFQGLTLAELDEVATICQEAVYQRGEVIMTQGEPGDTLFIVHEGMVEVRVLEEGETQPRTVIGLGAGQVVGEFALLDGGVRSATVLCATPQAVVTVMSREKFEALCATQHHIGMAVYRNLAADVSFKLRHRHLPAQLAAIADPLPLPPTGEEIICKVSVVVPGHPALGAIISTNSLPQVGDRLAVGEREMEVLEIRDLLPPRDEFHFMHATCKPV